MALLRKLHTISTILRNCRNGCAVVAAKLGLNPRLQEVQVREGPTIKTDVPLLEVWGAVFESAVADIYRIRESNADLIVDVGANIGSFSCLAAWSHPKSKVYAFEPNPFVIKQAKVNLRQNNLENIHLIESVVTGDGREVTLNLDENMGGASIYLEGSGKKLSLSSVTLDCVPFSAAKSVFFKLDCEGAEGEIFQWIITHLEKLPARIQIACEYHPWCPRPLNETLRDLRANGFLAETDEELGACYLRADR